LGKQQGVTETTPAAWLHASLTNLMLSLATLQVDGDQAWASLAEVETPVLVVSGIADELVSPTNQIGMASQLPGAIVKMFPGKHNAYFAYLEEFVEVYDAFLLTWGRGQEVPGVVEEPQEGVAG
jgi:pimeloyl-ACP methyl ester carboxylesterase